jgi:type II secretory pathway pseudopilin PulG
LLKEKRESCFCRRCGLDSFSLIEVVIALGIATFAILIIVALLPAGIRSTKDSLDETHAVNILSQIISDRRSTPYANSSYRYSIPALTTATAVTNYFGILEDDQYTNALSQAAYRVDYVLTPPLSGQLGPYQLYLKVSWPAASLATNGGAVETVATMPQP